MEKKKGVRDLVVFIEDWPRSYCPKTLHEAESLIGQDLFSGMQAQYVSHIRALHSANARHIIVGS